MATFNDYYSVSCSLHKKLAEYYIENNLEIDGVYHKAKQLLAEMDQKAFHDREYLEFAIKWFETKSTLDLKEALYKIDWTDIGSNYFSFNAFTLLDTCIIKI